MGGALCAVKLERLEMKIKLQLTHEDKSVTYIPADSDEFGEVAIVEYEGNFFVYDSQNTFVPGIAKFQQVPKPVKIES